MKLETFFEHFDLLAEAPNGVQKLRELILDLAVRGKLVSQDANDEPAAVLLERIKKEKEKLVKEGKFQITKNTLTKVDYDHLPFSIPDNWEWSYLDDIAIIARGGSPRPIKLFLTEDSSGINWIKIGDTDKKSMFITHTKEKIIREGLTKTRMVFPNDLILSNSMSYGHPFILKIQGCIHDGWLLIRTPENLVYKEFLYYMFLSDYTKKVFSEAAAGGVVQNLNADKVRSLLFPFPPLNEQKRIVTKVDELMKLCDELEARQKKKRETRILINNAALNKLLTADTPETFTKNWQRIGDNFDILYSAPENIGKLRQAILQLAVMGKLVPQDANDEPAAVLLERIKKEKERLIKEGKIKKEKSLTEIKNDEIPYDLPKGWEWERVTNLCKYIVDCLHSTPEFITDGKLCIDTTCLNQGEILFHKIRKVSEETFLERIRRLQPLAGDILFSREGTIGLSIIVPEGLEICLGQRMMMFRTFRWLIPEYFRYVLISKMFVNQWEKKLIGTAARHINIGDIKKMIIPFPPVNEQKRIVSKVDKLMKLCDELETKLTQTQTESEKIINAAVKQLLTV
ncbi:restriction endonuclease subunit S [Trichormus sp. NMC-1]|uniref:restriction endonuclease subunit S n=1 Tax=Trichormus sp. NMC-1 TaxID=1853259 RepID=UPI0008DBF51B|nr:restriction endonuclease subunit S [Trichormus sp. NMC-1]